MNYYHLSYDLTNVEPGDNDEALRRLVSLIVDKLAGNVLNMPVRTSLVFGSNFDFELVRGEILSWSKDFSAFYVVSEIANRPQSGLSCRMVSNKDLENSLKELVADVES